MAHAKEREREKLNKSKYIDASSTGLGHNLQIVPSLSVARSLIITHKKAKKKYCEIEARQRKKKYCAIDYRAGRCNAITDCS
jgi:hypothetical protein